MMRLVIYVCVAAALLGGGYLALPKRGPGQSSADALHYALTDNNGNRVSETTFGARYSLVAFGYTYCPDVCPTTLLDMGQVMDLLGDQSRNLVPLFISIDPERDHPEVLKDYLSAYHPAIVGLTGSADETADAVRSFHAFAQKEAADKNQPYSYLMSHSALLYVVGPNGQGPIQRFSYGDPPEKIAAALRTLL